MCLVKAIYVFARSHAHTHTHTHTQEVKIPGRKSFGFTYETRLFISTVDEGSTASDWLLPGDEIVQVRMK